MGAIIKATAISQDPQVRGSIAHAAQAGRHCLSAAGVPLSDVGLLINTGVYRDDNLVEPAMAALIQGDIGMGLDFTRYPGEPYVVSFDLMNGACGLLNAVQVADSFLRAGGVRHVLIVSSDAHPGDRADDAYPYATLGGAVLLSQGEGDEQGFGSLSVRASQPGATPGVTGYVPLGHGARVQIRVDREPDYSERLCAFAAETAQAYAAQHGIDLKDALLITSQPSPDFPAALAARLGLSTEQAHTITGVSGEPHSAALALGYHQAAAAGRLRPGQRVLFVAAGAGLSCACAAYRC